MNQKIDRIIVRMPNWLGDAVMATPCLRDIKRAFPRATLTAMCQGGIGDLLAGSPFIDDFLRFKKISGWIHTGTHPDILMPLKKGDYDLGVLFTNSFSSAYWFWRGGVKKRLGFNTHYRRLFLNMPVSLPKDIEERHLVDVYKDLLVPLGIPRSDSVPELFLSKEEIAEAKAQLDSYKTFPNQKVIGINPGAAFGSAKCWPKEKFDRLIEKIIVETSHLIVCFGDQTGAPLVQMITQGKGDRVVNLAGKTNLRQLMALIKECNALLTNDSGPMHIAAALQVPLVAVFGSTNPTKTGPYGGGEVIYKKTSCSPCYRRVCPIDFRCMERIEVDEVFQRLIKLV
jgi:heptosyltransferase-2